MHNDAQPNDQSSPANLPALLPPVALLLQRTQTTLGLVRDVVQESSARYWCSLGQHASTMKDWGKAIYYYHKCRETPGDMMRFEALSGLITALEGRAESKICDGDFAGCDLDRFQASEAEAEHDYWVSACEAYWDR